MEPSGNICPSCKQPLPAETPLGGLCPACLIRSGFYSGTAPEPEKHTKFKAPAVGDLAPHFPQLEILELIGRGGMGAVYKARQPKLNRFVALKILAREGDTDARFADRFQREAQALAHMNHPNIVTVYDFGEAGGHFYLLMEFVDGMNLRQLEQTSKLAPEEALTIVPPICDALQYAHSQGIVHRDIKPENILLDKNGRVKIADFGIAKILGTGTSPEEPLTGDDQRVGTPHYMAPEQVEKPTTVDHRADIYSLGVVFYEMLTGELPLGRFAPPSHRVQIDVRLDEIVMRALEKEPELRYQQASEIRTQVETLSSGANKTSASLNDGNFQTTATKADPGGEGMLKFLLFFMFFVLMLFVYNVAVGGFDQFGIVFFFVILMMSIVVASKLMKTPRKTGDADLRTWGPGLSPQTREICAHMTEQEKNSTAFRGVIWGICSVAVPAALSLSYVYGSLSLWAAIAIYLVVFAIAVPIWQRMQKEFLCSSQWARQQGISPDELKLNNWFGTADSRSAGAAGANIRAPRVGAIATALTTCWLFSFVVLGAMLDENLRRVQILSFILVAVLIAIPNTVMIGYGLARRWLVTPTGRDRFTAFAALSFLLAIPVCAFGAFFVLAMISEFQAEIKYGTGWNPDLDEAMGAGFICVGSIMLPWAGFTLLRARRAVQSPRDSSAASGSQSSFADSGKPAQPVAKAAGDSLHIASPTTVTGPSRLSRAAIVGAAWAVLFVVTTGISMVIYSNVAPTELSGALFFLWSFFNSFGRAAIFGTTILGWIALGHIRRSGGRLYGLGLALFDAFLFPMLALMAGAWWLASWYIDGHGAANRGFLAWMIEPDMQTNGLLPKLLAVAAAIMLCGLLMLAAAHRVRKGLNARDATSQRTSFKAVLVLAVITTIAVVGFRAITSNFTIPNLGIIGRENSRSASSAEMQSPQPVTSSDGSITLTKATLEVLPNDWRLVVYAINNTTETKLLGVEAAVNAPGPPGSASSIPRVLPLPPGQSERSYFIDNVGNHSRPADLRFRITQAASAELYRQGSQYFLPPDSEALLETDFHLDANSVGNFELLTAESRPAGAAPEAQTYSSGVRAELVGVAAHPRNGEVWTASGNPIPEIPQGFEEMDLSSRTFEDQVAREIYLKFTGLKEEDDFHFVRELKGSIGHSGESRYEGDVKFYSIGATFPEGQQETKVRVGIASGPWQTVAEGDFSSSGFSSQGSGTGGSYDVKASGLVVADGKPHIILSDNMIGKQIVPELVDTNGKVHRSYGSESSESSNLRQSKFFFDAPILSESIKRIVVKTRAYEWREFPGVKLQPVEGQQTETGNAAVVAKLTDETLSPIPEGTKPVTTGTDLQFPEVTDANTSIPNFSVAVYRSFTTSTQNQFLDLETGSCNTPPAELLQALKEKSPMDLVTSKNGKSHQFAEWVKQTGVDLALYDSGTLLTFGGTWVQAHGNTVTKWNDWNILTPEAAISGIREHKIGEPNQKETAQIKNYEIGPIGVITASHTWNWFFKTRDGGTGVLQVAADYQNQTAPFRYKLVTAGNDNVPSGGVLSSALDYGFAHATKSTIWSPDFESFFPDDEAGAAKLEALWNSTDKDSRSDEEILSTIRSGLRRLRVDRRMPVLRWMGNKYIWNQPDQHPLAIEIMYHAAETRRDNLDPYGTRDPAIYFGLSVVKDKTPAILRTLVDIAMLVDDPNDLDRIAWGTESQQQEMLKFLEPHIQSDDLATKAKADVVRRILTGELKAFQWATERAKEKAAVNYKDQLPAIKTTLTSGTSEERTEALQLILRERLTLIMDDSFIAAFAEAAKDSNPRVRREVARIVGEHWVWSAKEQNPQALALMLNLSEDEDRQVRHNAVYFGLSTVRPMMEVVVWRMLEIAIDDREPNNYQRIAWALKNHRELAKQVLHQHFLTNKKTRAAAQEIYKDMTGAELPSAALPRSNTLHIHQDAVEEAVSSDMPVGGGYVFDSEATYHFSEGNYFNIDLGGFLTTPTHHLLGVTIADSGPVLYLSPQQKRVGPLSYTCMRVSRLADEAWTTFTATELRKQHKGLLDEVAALSGNDTLTPGVYIFQTEINLGMIQVYDAQLADGPEMRIRIKRVLLPLKAAGITASDPASTNGGWEFTPVNEVDFSQANYLELDLGMSRKADAGFLSQLQLGHNGPLIYMSPYQGNHVALSYAQLRISKVDDELWTSSTADALQTMHHVLLGDSSTIYGIGTLTTGTYVFRTQLNAGLLQVAASPDVNLTGPYVRYKKIYQPTCRTREEPPQEIALLGLGGDVTTAPNLYPWEFDGELWLSANENAFFLDIGAVFRPQSVDIDQDNVFDWMGLLYVDPKQDTTQTVSYSGVHVAKVPDTAWTTYNATSLKNQRNAFQAEEVASRGGTTELKAGVIGRGTYAFQTKYSFGLLQAKPITSATSTGIEIRYKKNFMPINAKTPTIPDVPHKSQTRPVEVTLLDSKVSPAKAYFDLDTGATVAPPDGLTTSSNKVYDWAFASGVDVVADTTGTVPGLVGYSPCMLVHMPDSAWDTGTSETVTAAIEAYDNAAFKIPHFGVGPQYEARDYTHLTMGSTVPPTFAFKTGGGNVGLLQLLHTSLQPSEPTPLQPSGFVKFRYKSFMP